MMATSYWSPDGKPISANQMIERLFGELPRFFKDESELRSLWSQPETRKSLLEALGERGFGGEQLAEIGRMIAAEKSDVFDVLAYIAFAVPPITRAERVEERRSVIMASYQEKVAAFLDFVMGQYIREGVSELDREKLAPLLTLKYQSVTDAVSELGGVAAINDAFLGAQKALFT
jgi:type I restriction enzyme R subunit